MTEPQTPPAVAPPPEPPPQPAHGLQLARLGRRRNLALPPERPADDAPLRNFDAGDLRRKARRRANGRRAFDGMSVVLLTASAWLAGLILFAETVPAMPLTPPAHADGIVVLTGGSMRIEQAVRLLNEGRAERLLISGVNPGAKLEEVLREANVSSSKADCCIDLDYADSTQANARMAAQWAQEHKLKSLTLVTASYHMRRAVLEFDLNLPAETTLATFAVQPSRETLPSWWRWPAGFQVLVGEYHKFLFSMLRYAVLKPVQLATQPSPAALPEKTPAPAPAAPPEETPAPAAPSP